jgi:hypothetical protein
MVKRLFLAGGALAVAVTVVFALGGQRPALAQPAVMAFLPTASPTAQPSPTSPSISIPLTTTTVSLFEGDVCAVWGRTVGSLPAVSVRAGPVLVVYSTYSYYRDLPHHEYKYTFANRVGDSTAAFTLNGRPWPMLYRGELRIEYLPAPVSKRYSYATYAQFSLEPGDYEVSADWHFASGEKDGLRKCHLTVTP